MNRCRPKNYADITQQKRNNKKCYTLAFKYYIYEVIFTFFNDMKPKARPIEFTSFTKILDA